MKNPVRLTTFALLLLWFAAFPAEAQKKAADYVISAVRIVPFDGQTGKFQDEIREKDEMSFFNRLSISLFVTIEISGQKNTYETGRKIDVTVTEGGRLKTGRSEQIGSIGSGGKVYFPLWLDAAMCSDVTITARITGQKTASTVSRKVAFLCGE